MQRDLLMEAVSDQELDNLERNFQRDLGDGRGRSYIERQQIALNYLRCIVERHIRESERRMGHRK